MMMMHHFTLSANICHVLVYKSMPFSYGSIAARVDKVMSGMDGFLPELTAMVLGNGICSVPFDSSKRCRENPLSRVSNVLLAGYLVYNVLKLP